MAVTPQDITALATELSSESADRIGIFIGLAGFFVDAGTWGAKYGIGLKLMAAHLLTLANRQGNAGSVTQETVGDVSRSYSATAPTNSELALTSYGQMYLTLRRTLVITPLSV